ncbi:basic helix-loop-helix domain-containing protein [Pedobacter gandavensis]|uniref:Uncharacterized protein n=1 Tax=Pedobacter gandavensis TaxID=2679963 RepID=A0ABR6EU39_9SPHI|nr:hypothetical protein [Pedobacter gandavensis]MBB2148789.1 hypothetical protein [Pedobacter gandavensis]
MEPFEINLDGKLLNVILNEDGSYLIHDSNAKLGTLIPEVNDLGVQWTTLDQLTPDYVRQIGELIEEHDL